MPDFQRNTPFTGLLDHLPDVEAIVFDAVGTVIFPSPSVAEAYQNAIFRHSGQKPDLNVVRSTVQAALGRRSQESSLQTSESAEHEFWLNLVRQLFPGQTGFQACFDDLFQHFAQPQHWKCFPEVAEVLKTLADHGISIAIASNFDLRLNSVCDGLAALEPATNRIISSVVGWRKPAPQFFSAVSECLNLPFSKILMVGDDPINDVKGSLKVGMPAALIHRTSPPPAVPQNACLMSSLTDLILHSQSVDADELTHGRTPGP